jgi:hypothetical protein
MNRFPPAPQGGLLRFLAIHLVIGVVSGLVFALALVATNVAGLSDLIARTGQPAIALFALCFVNALTFGSLAMGAGIMGLPRERHEPDKPQSSLGGDKDKK